VSATKTEWSLDALRTPSATNAQLEGDVYTYNAVTATTRVGNYTQISRESYVVTKTQEAIDKAGMKSELGAQRAKAGASLKTDIELSIISNNASVGGQTRQSGGLRAWLATNDSMGGSGASGGYNTGTGVVDAATPGTQRAFNKTLLDDTIQNVYTAGGSATKLHVSPYIKRVFSSFMSDSQVAAPMFQVKGSDDVTIIGSADVYRSDFGVISVIPNRQMARAGATYCRNAFLLDDSKLKIGWLRKIGEDKDVAPNADSFARVMLGEWTLRVDNEQAHGVVADLFGFTSAS
jgi:hypothetical protein